MTRSFGNVPARWSGKGVYFLVLYGLDQIWALLPELITICRARMFVIASRTLGVSSSIKASRALTIETKVSALISAKSLSRSAWASACRSRKGATRARIVVVRIRRVGDREHAPLKDASYPLGCFHRRPPIANHGFSAAGEPRIAAGFVEITVGHASAGLARV